ncbi:hypothetical protein [Methylobacterium isbiliense]|jgi:hypothetical protein|uniref:Glutamine amidotransferase n=1 Tax=Methylobacterium isbiliense TaxID=315478 RepID=A0ABQ4SPI3_9HYPH|nr:hypothetical protein [Methylobacterium isbiliense]MDN3626707.1 hypothetical protein [Methylobacterium isbiliense]GJE03788.1 hypothetical protein GMJLKIPL_5745 [Methylobacterium isbiliense]
MYTLEIDGTPVAIIRSTEARARELLEVEGFKDDLRTMTSDGRPLWSGEAAHLKLRPSTEQETETFDDAMAEDDEFDDEPDDAGTPAADSQDTSDEEDEDVDILFLVDIDDESAA